VTERSTGLAARRSRIRELEIEKFEIHLGRGRTVAALWSRGTVVAALSSAVFLRYSSRALPMPTAMPSGFGVRRALAPLSGQVENSESEFVIRDWSVLLLRLAILEAPSSILVSTMCGAWY
jgi:hypothetical protein